MTGTQPRPRATPPDSMSLLVCDGCPRTIPTFDASAMLDAIKGCCPACGGRFQLDGMVVAQPATTDGVGPSRLA